MRHYTISASQALGFLPRYKKGMIPVGTIPLTFRYFYLCIYLFLGYVLHGEADSAHLVLAKANNLNSITKRKNIFNSINSFLSNL